MVVLSLVIFYQRTGGRVFKYIQFILIFFDQDLR